MNSLNLSEIKAVAFDIDGTLYRTWKFNIRMPFHFFIHCFFFLKYGLVRNELRKKEISGNIQQIQAEMMAKRLKCSPEKAISELDRIVYSGLEKKFETIKPCKGVVEFIKKLKDGYYPDKAVDAMDEAAAKLKLNAIISMPDIKKHEEEYKRSRMPFHEEQVSYKLQVSTDKLSHETIYTFSNMPNE